MWGNRRLLDQVFTITSDRSFFFCCYILMLTVYICSSLLQRPLRSGHGCCRRWNPVVHLPSGRDGCKRGWIQCFCKLWLFFNTFLLRQQFIQISKVCDRMQLLPHILNQSRYVWCLGLLVSFCTVILLNKDDMIIQLAHKTLK